VELQLAVFLPNNSFWACSCD